MKKTWFSDLKTLNLEKFKTKNTAFSKIYNHNKQLNIRGVGYKSWIQNSKLNFDLGLTHYISVSVPVFANVISKKTKLIISSKSNENLGIFCSEIKNLKYPDPYKGKGIRYSNDSIKLKVGKVKN